MTADAIVGISVAVIVVIFSLQRLGSSRTGFLYSPILITWFLVNAAIGIYNIAKWQPDVFKAVSPSYALRYFQSGSRGAWLSLGGCVLCITGSQATFASTAIGNGFGKNCLLSQQCATLLLCARGTLFCITWLTMHHMSYHVPNECLHHESHSFIHSFYRCSSMVC